MTEREARATTRDFHGAGKPLQGLLCAKQAPFPQLSHPPACTQFTVTELLGCCFSESDSASLGTLLKGLLLAVALSFRGFLCILSLYCKLPDLPLKVTRADFEGKCINLKDKHLPIREDCQGFFMGQPFKKPSRDLVLNFFHT